MWHWQKNSNKPVKLCCKNILNTPPVKSTHVFRLERALGTGLHLMFRLWLSWVFPCQLFQFSGETRLSLTITEFFHDPCHVAHKVEPSESLKPEQQVLRNFAISVDQVCLLVYFQQSFKLCFTSRLESVQWENLFNSVFGKRKFIPVNFYVCLSFFFYFYFFSFQVLFGRD